MIFPRPDGRWEVMVAGNANSMFHPVRGAESEAEARHLARIGPDDPVIGGNVELMKLWTERDLQHKVDELWRRRDRLAVL